MSEGVFITLNDPGEFQFWHSCLVNAMSRVPVGEAMAEADTALRGLRQRVPALLKPAIKLNG